ncbi:hypothetical protein FA13DRAFT_1711840 [Coprinellus micaceus]|uniref:Uncharacterized protein n=1 Tax=Coprinellus micaceus TaxID=71717 RepID=A0A4Y7T308_COPMI|nr:hypothetical protein FA13DRAFT_1711840 [Coprinellus micaceus]
MTVPATSKASTSPTAAIARLAHGVMDSALSSHPRTHTPSRNHKRLASTGGGRDTPYPRASELQPPAALPSPALKRRKVEEGRPETGSLGHEDARATIQGAHLPAVSPRPGALEASVEALKKRVQSLAQNEGLPLAPTNRGFGIGAIFNGVWNNFASTSPAQLTPMSGIYPQEPMEGVVVTPTISRLGGNVQQPVPQSSEEPLGERGRKMEAPIAPTPEGRPLDAPKNVGPSPRALAIPGAWREGNDSSFQSSVGQVHSDGSDSDASMQSITQQASTYDTAMQAQFSTLGLVEQQGSGRGGEQVTRTVQGGDVIVSHHDPATVPSARVNGSPGSQIPEPPTQPPGLLLPAQGIAMTEEKAGTEAPAGTDPEILSHTPEMRDPAFPVRNSDFHAAGPVEGCNEGTGSTPSFAFAEPPAAATTQAQLEPGGRIPGYTPGTEGPLKDDGVGPGTANLTDAPSPLPSVYELPDNRSARVDEMGMTYYTIDVMTPSTNADPLSDSDEDDLVPPPPFKPLLRSFPTQLSDSDEEAPVRALPYKHTLRRVGQPPNTSEVELVQALPCNAPFTHLSANTPAMPAYVDSGEDELVAALPPRPPVPPPSKIRSASASPSDTEEEERARALPFRKVVDDVVLHSGSGGEELVQALPYYAPSPYFPPKTCSAEAAFSDSDEEERVAGLRVNIPITSAHDSVQLDAPTQAEAEISSGAGDLLLTGEDDDLPLPHGQHASPDAFMGQDISIGRQKLAYLRQIRDILDQGRRAEPSVGPQVAVAANPSLDSQARPSAEALPTNKRKHRDERTLNFHRLIRSEVAVALGQDVKATLKRSVYIDAVWEWATVGGGIRGPLTVMEGGVVLCLYDTSEYPDQVRNAVFSWNCTIIEDFAPKFCLRNPQYTEEEAMEHFKTHLKHLKRSFRRYLKGTIDTDGHDSKALANARQRRINRYFRRLRTCERYKDAFVLMMLLYMILLSKMNWRGCSGDEMDEEELCEVTKKPRHLITTLDWRARSIRELMRKIDALDLFDRFVDGDRAIAGKFPEPRYDPRDFQGTKARTINENFNNGYLKSLPRNFYDDKWFHSLEPHEKESLDYQKPIDLTLPDALESPARDDGERSAYATSSDLKGIGSRRLCD